MAYPARKHAISVVQQLLGIVPKELQTKTQYIYLSGEKTTFRHDTDRELPFRQESNFFYLSGCAVPSSALLLAYTPTTHKLVTKLFIPAEDPLETMWSPPPPTLDAASRTHDADGIFFTSTLTNALQDIPSSDAAVLHVLPTAPTFPAHLQPPLAGQATDEYLYRALGEARLIKTEEEIALMRVANTISSRAHEVVMRLLGKGVRSALPVKRDTPPLPGDWLIEKESEAEAVFVASCRREGAVHQAYLPIVAASTRASTLHYCCNDKEFAWGPTTHTHEDGHLTHAHGLEGHEVQPQVLLIDAGCEWSCYAADITRTMPVGNGGKFTAEAGAVYELVLQMQKDALALVRASTHWDDVQQACHVTLTRGFLKLGIFKGSEEDILNSDVTTAFFPHGVGHSIGLDVHDVPHASKPPAATNTTIPALSKQHPKFHTYLRLRLPLRAGMVVTVEPGIYFSPHLLAAVRNSPLIDHALLARYEPVGGVRIEDVVLVTETGHEILSPVGKERDWVEGVCSGAL
ncbi:Creatinase/aminopeptidase [Auricularia subglabra TFB-10046 SS5]|nr:Creatinase/aminopeptidase [Auricularia subglabra TFB-10046 SS5]